MDSEFVLSEITELDLLAMINLSANKHPTGLDGIVIIHCKT